MNDGPQTERKRVKRLKNSELVLFCTQVSLFLRAGLSLVEGLSLLQEDIGNPVFQDILRQVSDGIEARQPLSQALEATGAFPPYLLRMAAIGEASGNLDDIMSAQAAYYEREGQLKQRIRSSVVYPIILVVMMAAIVLLLIVQVLPMFDDLLRSLGGEMPTLVRGLMAFGQFIGRWWWLILVALAALAVLHRALRATAGGRAAFDRFKARFFITRAVYQKIAAERFSSAMAFLLGSSVDFEIALKLTADILDNRYMSDKIENCGVRIGAGESASDALYGAGIFPRLFTRMLAVGFKTGNLDGMMHQLSEIYEQEVDVSLGRIVGSIEPAFVALLSILVGVILISVMLPLIQIMSSIG
ncbi:MAG: type II secretion system F family protein [Oscillospiraceae bacterium]|jgi:type IV pilus assembly protein PilC|nr:type II secretion system F family protein [Oscillospiraceae bacterium]